MMVHNHRMADGVDATSASASGKLGELPWRQSDMPGPIEFLKFFHHHAPCRHVDAQGKCFRGEDDLHQPLFEQSFDNLAEERHHASMMRRESFLQGEAELREMQSLQILLTELAFDHLIDDTADATHLVIGGEFESGVDALFDGLIASVAGEDEIDARQDAEEIQFINHGPTTWRMAFGSAGMVVPFAALSSVGALLSPTFRGLAVELIEPAHQLGVELVCLIAVFITSIQVDEFRFGVVVRLNKHMLFQRHGPFFGHHQRGVATDRFNPFGEVLDIRHGCGQADDSHALGQVDDHFLPHRPAETVGEIVHLVKNHVTQGVKRHGMLVEHVAQDLGGHDHDVGFGVDGRVAGKQADSVRPVRFDQIMVFLIAQRFDWRGVERFDVTLLGQIDREISHDRLAGSGGRGDEHIVAGFQRIIGFDLEIVQFEWHGPCETRRDRLAFGLRLFERRIALRGR